MEYKIVFRDKLTELKTAAENEGNVITKDKVHEFFKGIPLEESHFQLIYDYLSEQNIQVSESEKIGNKESDSINGSPEGIFSVGEKSAGEILNEEEESPDTDEAQDGLSFYVDEMKAISDMDDTQEASLIRLAREGDGAASDKLIELYLPVICAMAADFENEDTEKIISAEDLIQEGNMGLLMAVQSLGEYDSIAACRAHIINSVRDAIETALNNGQESKKKDDDLVSRVNKLNEAIHELEEDLGYSVTAEEVSAYLNMPLEEIESLIRVTVDQIKTE